MKLHTVFLACLLALALLVSVHPGAAQGDLPPFPPNSTAAILLFPGVIQDGAVGAGMTQQRYMLVANSGNILDIAAQMAEPGVIAGLQLYDAQNSLLLESSPPNASSTLVALSYEVAANGWYFLDVNFVANVPESQYTLALTGTTPSVFALLEAGRPPSVAGAHLLASSAELSGVLEAGAMTYLIPLGEGDTLSVEAQGASQPRLRITMFEANAPVQTLIAEAPQAGAAVSYSTLSDRAQWVQLDVEPGQAGAFTLNVEHPRPSGTAQDFTLTGGSGPGPGAAGQCGGIPARFQEGDLIVVSQEGDNLQILSDYTGGTRDTVALAVWGDQLEVLDAPVCHHSTFHQQDMWFWNIYSYTDDINGWVADGLAAERWVCPADDPACNQAAECGSVPVQFQVGDTIVVSQRGDNLQIQRYPGETQQTIALAVSGDELEVLGGPNCYHSPYHQENVWYWHIYSPTDGAEGWVADGIASERWVCPASEPACDQ